MTTLILSTTANEHANAVEKKLWARGTRVLRLNVDQTTSNTLLHTVRHPITRLAFAGTPLNAQEVVSVFVHHARIAIPESEGTDATDRGLAASGWRNMLDWLESSLVNVAWINAPTSSRRSASTLLQLQVAQRCGFRTPATVITNSIADVAEFSAIYSKIIVKTGPLLGVSLVREKLLSHLVDPDAIDAEVLRSSPCLFQEYIEKRFELRVHVIGDTVLACKIESQSTAATVVDWRNYAISKTPHLAVTLDSALERTCCAIVKGLGLAFGILDLIVTPDGEPVFLECNSQGHWLWIEKLTGLEVTEAICSRLA